MGVVCSFCTSIPRKGGLAATAAEFENWDLPVEMDKNTLPSLLRPVLNYNNVEFRKKYYIKIPGIEMETKNGPSYAKAFRFYRKEIFPMKAS